MNLVRLAPFLLLTLPWPATAKAPRLATADVCKATLQHPPVFGCVNRANLAAMAADPHDLSYGRASSLGVGALDAAAVDRLLTGRAKKLAGTTTDGSQPAAAPSGAP
jgi:type IV pilus biogenesis protein CpaD/CtpE